MSNASATVLIGLTAWTLLLLILMEALRSRLTLMKAVAANEFKPDNSNLSPFMQRLAERTPTASRACLFSVLLIVALLTNRHHKPFGPLPVCRSPDPVLRPPHIA